MLVIFIFIMMKALAAVFAFYGCSLFLGIDSPPHVTIL
jgi:hypothetical protein